MKRLALALAAAAIAGCSGNAGSVLGPMPQPGAPLPSGAASSAQFVIKVPASTTSAAFRKPMYISPSTKSIAISANGGAAVTANLTPGSPGCVAATSNTPLTCTVSISAPTGTDTFTLITYDGANGTGNKLSTATVSALIAPSPAQNVVPVVLNGIVSSIQLVLSNCCPPADNTPHVIKLTVNAMDADGNVIVGPGNYANPITLSDSDTSGHTKLSTTMLNSPTDASAVTVLYDGSPALKSATFCASASGVTPANVKCATLTPSAATAQSFIYVANIGGADITAYALSANGNQAPDHSIGGNLTDLSSPDNIAFDSSGNLYATQTVNSSGIVTEYAKDASGNAAPTRTISGTATTLGFIVGIAVDAAGEIYVANFTPLASSTPAIAVFAAGANGNVAPIRDITGSNTGLANPISLALDALGDLYVVNQYPASVTEYAPGSDGNVTPIRAISGSNTGLSTARGLALDASGEIYVGDLDAKSIFIYGPLANGNASPTRTIAGPNTGLGGINGIALDAGGNIYAANCSDCFKGAGATSVIVFPPNASGNQTPSRIIAGSNTSLKSPTDVKIGP